MKFDVVGAKIVAGVEEMWLERLLGSCESVMSLGHYLECDEKLLQNVTQEWCI